MLPVVGNGDQRKFTKNPCHFSKQNSQADSKKKSTKVFWRAIKVTIAGRKKSRSSKRRARTPKGYPEFCGTCSKVLQNISKNKKPVEERFCGTPKPKVGCTSSGSCNGTLLRRVLRRFSNSKCFLEGFLEGAL